MDFRWAKRDPVTGATIPQPSPYTVHPGLFQGFYDVRNLRPTDEPALTLPGGGRVLPMRFDGMAKIEGLPAGRTLARDVVGYLQIAPVGEPLSPSDLAHLLETQGGSAGGRIDDTINEGGFKLHALRVEAGVARPSGDPVLVGCVRAAPLFGKNGEWAVGRTAGPSAPPGTPPGTQAVDDGVPLIRTGRAGVPVGDAMVLIDPPGALRIADPRDLFVPTTPIMDYGFVQSAPTHSFFFRRPVLQPGATQLSSDLSPLLVDVFARVRSAALFPPPVDCIPLTNTAYTMPIDAATGSLTLAPPVNNLMLGPLRGDLRLVDAATAGATPRLRRREAFLPNRAVGLVFRDARLEDVDRLRGQAGGGRAVHENSRQFHDAPGLREHRHLNGLHSRGPVEFHPRVRGPWRSHRDQSTSPRRTLRRRGWSGPRRRRKSRLPPGTKFLKLHVYAETEARFGPPAQTENYAGALVGVELRGQLPPTSVGFFIYGCQLELGGKQFLSGPLQGQTKPSFELRAFIGWGYGGNLGPFEATVAAMAGPVLQFEPPEWAVGGFLRAESNVTVIGFKVQIYAEFVALYVVKSGANLVHFEGEVGVNVEIGWFIEISISFNVVEEQEL